MNINKYLFTSTIIATLLCSNITIEAATKKKEKVNKKEQKEALKEIKNKKQKINPTEAFYDKIWNKYKVGDKNDKEDVIKTLKKIIKDTPDEFMAYYYLGIMSYDVEQSNQALRYFDTALSYMPNSSDIHLRMAKILEENNNIKEANNHYISALSIDNNNPIALSKVGIIELNNKNYEKAEEYLIKAKKLQPDNSETLKALGECWLNQLKYSNAAEILEQVLLFDNTDANSHFLLGKAYEKFGNYEKAAQHIELASKYGKKDSSLKNAIGYDIARNLTNSGKYEEAISAYKKEIKTNKAPAQGYYEMGEVFEKLEDGLKAVKAYQKAYELDKKLIKGIHRCVEIYQNLDDKVNAEKMLKILKSNSEYKEEATEMIEEIKRDEKEKAEQAIADKINSKDTKDANLESAYLEMYENNKKDSDSIENLYNYYKERGYYDEAIKWYRKYAKSASISDAEKKRVEKELKSKLEQDNYTLFGEKDDDKPNKSKVSSDELLTIAFNGDNDRQKELALQILLSRKDYKEDRKIVEGLANFYEERGKVKEATKYINQMKKLGYLSETQAKERKARLKE